MMRFDFAVPKSIQSGASDLPHLQWGSGRQFTPRHASPVRSGKLSTRPEDRMAEFPHERRTKCHGNQTEISSRLSSASSSAWGECPFGPHPPCESASPFPDFAPPGHVQITACGAKTIGYPCLPGWRARANLLVCRWPVQHTGTADDLLLGVGPYRP